jgi:hypothetical protein
VVRFNRYLSKADWPKHINWQKFHFGISQNRARSIDVPTLKANIFAA